MADTMNPELLSKTMLLLLKATRWDLPFIYCRLYICRLNMTWFPCLIYSVFIETSEKYLLALGRPIYYFFKT